MSKKVIIAGSNGAELTIRRLAAGLRNFEHAYKAAVDAWAKYDNMGESPVLLEWGENS